MKFHSKPNIWTFWISFPTFWNVNTCHTLFLCWFLFSPSHTLLEGKTAWLKHASKNCFLCPIVRSSPQFVFFLKQVWRGSQQAYLCREWVCGAQKSENLKSRNITKTHSICNSAHGLCTSMERAAMCLTNKSLYMLHEAAPSTEINGGKRPAFGSCDHQIADRTLLQIRFNKWNLLLSKHT